MKITINLQHASSDIKFSFPIKQSTTYKQLYDYVISNFNLSDPNEQKFLHLAYNNRTLTPYSFYEIKFEIKNNDTFFFCSKPVQETGETFVSYTVFARSLLDGAYNDIEQVERILMMHPEFCTQSDNVSESVSSTSLLIFCIERQLFNLAVILIQCGVDINSFNNKFSPLTRAIVARNTAFVKLLLEYNAYVNIEDKDHDTPLIHACKYEFTEICEILLSHQAEINVRGSKDRSPIFYAAFVGNVSLLKLLITNGADVNFMTDNLSPLYYACHRGHDECIPVLLEAGANPQSGFRSPLYGAILEGRVKCVKRLIELKDKFYHKLNLSFIDSNGKTCLYYAVHCDQKEILLLLLEAGAKPNASGAGVHNPLYISCYSGKVEITQILLEHNADPNTGTTQPLFAAAQNGHYEIIKLLVKHGAIIDKIDNNGASSFMAAVHKGHLDILEYLISKLSFPEIRALVLHPDKTGKTPLYSVSWSGYLEIVKRLVELGSDVNFVDQKGCSPLYAAAQKNRSEIVKYLISVGADVNQQTHSVSNTYPLYAASYYNNIETLKLLIDAGGFVDRCVVNNFTCLYAAAQEGNYDTVRYLLEVGANPFIRTKDGWLPIEATKEDENGKLCARLLYYAGSESRYFNDNYKLEKDILDRETKARNLQRFLSCSTNLVHLVLPIITGYCYGIEDVILDDYIECLSLRIFLGNIFFKLKERKERKNLKNISTLISLFSYSPTVEFMFDNK